MELAMIAIFTTEGFTEGSNSGSLDPKLDALATRPRIHNSKINKISEPLVMNIPQIFVSFHSLQYGDPTVQYHHIQQNL